MVFENKQLSWPNLFLSSLESLGDEHGCITLRWSLKVLVTNYFITEWLYITKKKKTKILGDAHFSSLTVFVIQCFICWKNISSTNILFIYLFIYFIKLLGDDSISSPKDLCCDKVFRQQLFLFYFLFFIKLWVKIFVFVRHHSSHFISHQK